MTDLLKIQADCKLKCPFTKKKAEH